MKLALTFATGVVSLLGAAGIQADDSFQIRVEDNTLTWGPGTFGYLQVQRATDWATICESQVYTLEDTPSGNRDGTACTVSDGVYNVINHLTRQRVDGLQVGELDGIYTAPAVETIDNVWVEYDPYLIIDANSVYSELVESVDVPAPANLYVTVYSPTAAELFWDRAAVPGLYYDALSDDRYLAGTDGTSLFLGNLNPGEMIDVELSARNVDGLRSERISISFQMPGGDDADTTELRIPTGLSASVYSDNSLELFWDRQGPGQQFEVYDGNGELLRRSDGVSYFAGNLPPADSHEYHVVAVDSDDNRSAAARIVVAMDGSAGEQAITLANAEALLAQVVTIANRDPFHAAQTLMSPGVAAVLASAQQAINEDEAPDNGLTLVEGSAGGPDTVNFAGRNGGDYICDAGGTAAGLSVYGGENNQGYIVDLDQCVLAMGRYTGRVRVADGGRSGYAASAHEGVEVAPFDEDITYRYNAIWSREYSSFPYANAGLTSDEMTVSTYVEVLSEGEPRLEVIDYQSRIDTRVLFSEGSVGEPVYREATANISFVLDSPAVTAKRSLVNIELAYDGDLEAEDPVDLWNSGAITITAVDGSELIATPEDVDADSVFESLRISVGEESIVRPLSDGYLVECRLATLAACNG